MPKLPVRNKLVNKIFPIDKTQYWNRFLSLSSLYQLILTLVKTSPPTSTLKIKRVYNWFTQCYLLVFFRCKWLVDNTLLRYTVNQSDYNLWIIKQSKSIFRWMYTYWTPKVFGIYWTFTSRSHLNVASQLIYQ